MADEHEEDVEITTEAKTTTYSDAIQEDKLELSLSLRPLNCSSSSFDHHSKKLLEPSSSNVGILSKRDAQALRRHEAKLKRDFKRKACVKNDVVVKQVTEDCLERRRKALNLGFQGERVAPPWLGWNNAGGFRPYQGQNGKFSSVNEGKDGASVSSGSSSGISDNCQSISGLGGNSSDTGSHSSNPHSQIPTPNVPTTSTTSQLQPCSSQLDLQPFSSNLDHSKPDWCSSYTNKIELITGSTQPYKSSEGVTSSSMTCQQNEAQPINDKTLSHKDPNTTSPSSSLPKGAVGENVKPPKPVGLIGQQKLLFSQMPCVSTTGNGPEGKTITGFLYKYTKAEVSIICVCHGASFSPAGFVEHAGGVDVEYPLKHIRVVPFGLG